MMTSIFYKLQKNSIKDEKHQMFYMEDDQNSLENGDDLNIFVNGRQPNFFVNVFQTQL